MLPLEFVDRRYAWGSYLKRNNKINSSDKPHVFKKPIYEIFHKHAVIMPPHVDQPRQMEESIAREKYLKNKSNYNDPKLMGWDKNNPEKWDWSAGCFTKIFSHLFHPAPWAQFLN